MRLYPAPRLSVLSLALAFVAASVGCAAGSDSREETDGEDGAGGSPSLSPAHADPKSTTAQAR